MNVRAPSSLWGLVAIAACGRLGYDPLTTLDALPDAPPDATTGLLLWNTLDSPAEVANSRIGPGGTYLSGTFIPGAHGQAWQVSYDQDNQVTFPATIIPADAGAVEMWFQLTGFATDLPWGQCPTLVSAPGLLIHLNGNDGAGGGGVCLQAGGAAACTDVFTTSFTYDALLGGATAWHHLAVVWDDNGIAACGAHKTCAFLDGAIETGRWNTDSGPFLAPTSGDLALMFHQGNLTQGAIAMDNLKIWNFAKTDFSDRFTE